jgi:Spy/CpxP family protein refolding chaperone
MKTTILRILLAATLAASLSFADGGKRGKRGNLDELGLSAEQKTQVETIMKEQRDALQAARRNNAQKQEMRAIAQKTRERLSTVLNEEQMKKFDENVKHGRGKRQPKG